MCKVDGCEHPVRTGGWCNAHYVRWHRTGSAQADKPVIRRTPHHVRRQWISDLVNDPPDTDECVEWPFSGHSDGYGEIHLEGKARRVSHLVLAGTGRPRPFPRSQALHACDNPPCCNPRHLRWGSYQDNADDAVERDRQVRGEDVSSSLLTEEKVVEMRQRYDAGGVTQAQLAEDYGVAQPTVSEVVRGVTWQHLL